MNLLFFILAIGALCSSLLVIFAANPVHSVLSLILVFCFSSSLLLTLNGAFIAILFIVVYVGAIAVIFLFVIMMLNIKIVQLSESTLRWLPIGFFVIIAFCTQFVFFYRAHFNSSSEIEIEWATLIFGASTLELLGTVLYSFFYLPFLLSALILLVALVGAITLTVGYQRGVRRQAVYKQVGRELFGAVKFYQ